MYVIIPAFLQNARCHAHARSAGSKHLSQEFLVRRSVGAGGGFCDRIRNRSPHGGYPEVQLLNPIKAEWRNIPITLTEILGAGTKLRRSIKQFDNEIEAGTVSVSLMDIGSRVHSSDFAFDWVNIRLSAGGVFSD